MSHCINCLDPDSGDLSVSVQLKVMKSSEMFHCLPQIYMNAAWHGWAIPMLLFLAILRLSLNYLIAR